ncbi:hypothetical protein HG531_003331 [Fusarium graminearum]|nr:hypothetical protein HG531_003331 [Fusarium graminearum]
MTSQPVVLAPATPSELLAYITSYHRYPTTLIIGSSKAEFHTALVEDVTHHLTLQDKQLQQDDPENSATEQSHVLLKATLYQIAISRHIRILFAPTVTHLRAYLSVFTPKNSLIPAPPNYTLDSSTPLLLIYGLLALHRDASEWSAQGIGNSAALLVDAASRNRFKAAVAEPKGGVDVRLVVVENVAQLGQVLLKIGGALEHIRSQFCAFLFQSHLFMCLLLQCSSELAFLLLGLFKSRSYPFLIPSKLKESLLELFVSHCLLLDLSFHRLARLDAGLCRLGLVVVLVDNSRLGLAEPDKVDQVAEDLDKAIRHIEAHQVASVGRNNICVLSGDILSSGTHGRLDSLACRIEEKLGEPFEYLLNMGGIWFLEICDGKGDADVGNTAYDLTVREAHKSIGLFLLLSSA